MDEYEHYFISLEMFSYTIGALIGVMLYYYKQEYIQHTIMYKYLFTKQ